MKKIFAILLIGLMLVQFVSCANDTDNINDLENSNSTDTTEDNIPTDSNDNNNDDNDDDSNNVSDENKENEDDFVALNKNTQGIKFLGVRSIASDAQINLDWSGSGIEFVINNQSSSLMIEASSSDTCRFKVFVNGTLHKSILNEEYYEIHKKGIITLQNLPTGELTIRVIKITDATLATAQLTKLVFTGNIITDKVPTDKELYIEFIGGTEVSGMFASGGTYANQDVTASYGYILAESMEADYSILSLAANMALTKATDVATIYSKASPLRDIEVNYDFARKANVVVLDIGAVDAALSLADQTVTAEAFAEKYEELLTAIREKNGYDCKIICVYTPIMGAFGTAIKNICENKMGGQSAGIYLCQRTTGENGVLSVEENKAFYQKLEKYVEAAISGKTIGGELGAEESGEGLNASFKDDFVPVSR